MLRSLPAALLSRTLVTDMLSVKQHAKDVMLDCVPADSDVLCMHPMFGPDSGRNSWRNLPCVYEQVCPPPVTASPHLAHPWLSPATTTCAWRQVRVSDFHRAARFLSLFEDEGCKMVPMSCEHHDALAAGSQFVTHLTGRLLSKLNLQPSPIGTTGFKALLKLVDNT